MGNCQKGSKTGIIFFTLFTNTLIMAEYTRGLERGQDRSRHNNQQQKATRRLQGIDFEAMNFEQRRAPYGVNTRMNDSVQDDAGNRGEPGTRRNEA